MSKRVDVGIRRFRELVAVMKAEGVTVAMLPDGTSATLGPKVAPATAKPVVEQRSCACRHRLSRHAPDGTCLERQPNGAPCQGNCRIIEGTGE